MSTTAALEQDLAWQQRIMLVVDNPSNMTTKTTQYVPVELVRNGVTYIILYSMFATLLFVLLCAVLFKNGLSPQKRRLPVIWVLGIAMLGGLLGSTLNTVFWAYQLFGNVSQGTMFNLWLSSTAMLYIVPLVTHIAIQLRLLSFYPSTLASRGKRIAISVLPTLMKIARLTTISITLSKSAQVYRDEGFGVSVSKATNDTSNLLTLIIQLVDCAYASFFLLWRYYRLGRRDNELVSHKSNMFLRWSKQIMFAMAFGYVCPTIYALALVLSRVLSISPVDMGFLLVANVYVQAFGAVLASLSSSYKWREDRFTDDLAPDNAVLPGMRDANELPATGAAAYRDSHPVTAFEAIMSESSTPFQPSFTTPGLASLGAGRRGTPQASTSGSDASLSARVVPTLKADGTSSSSAAIKAGDVSPKSFAHDHLPSTEKYLTGTPGAADHIAIDFPATYALQQYESRRSSDATLFAPVNGMSDKGDGPRHKGSCRSLQDGTASRPESRPGSSGTGRMQRLGSSRSVPRDGGLHDVAEAVPSPTQSQPHDV